MKNADSRKPAHQIAAVFDSEKHRRVLEILGQHAAQAELIGGDTRTGEVTGTPQYMSPEQAEGLKVDSAVDAGMSKRSLYAAVGRKFGVSASTIRHHVEGR